MFHSFSTKHLWAARYFADMAAWVEEKAMAEVTENDRQRHSAYVTGAVLCAAAFLDASINELFVNAGDAGNPKAVCGLDTKQKAALAKLSASDSKTLRKYERALTACRKKMDCTVEPWLSAQKLLDLRNALMHYEPEWSDGLDKHAKLETNLQHSFAISPLALPGQLWFPHQCLGSGCANWAAHQAAEFITAFCSQLGIPD